MTSENQNRQSTLENRELSESQLEALFRRLNLAHMRCIYQKVAERAEKENWSYQDFLAHLLVEEVARRKQARVERLTRRAHFPFFKTIDEFDFSLQSTLRQSLLGSYLAPDFVTEGRSLILYGETGRGKTHLAVAIGYRAIQNGFETFCTTAAELIEDLSSASQLGHLQEALATYTHPHVLVIDEVGYLPCGPDAANVLYHVVNYRHRMKRPIIFTTNKPLDQWGKVLHDEDLAAAILDRVLECGRFIHLDGPTRRARYLQLEETLPATAERVRISGICVPEFSEPTSKESLPDPLTYQGSRLPSLLGSGKTSRILERCSRMRERVNGIAVVIKALGKQAFLSFAERRCGPLGSRKVRRYVVTSLFLVLLLGAGATVGPRVFNSARQIYLPKVSPKEKLKQLLGAGATVWSKVSETARQIYTANLSPKEQLAQTNLLPNGQFVQALPAPTNVKTTPHRDQLAINRQPAEQLPNPQTTMEQAEGAPQGGILERLLAGPRKREIPGIHGDPQAKVWVDTHTGVYLCQGTAGFGKTSRGRYMTQQQARFDGFRPAYEKKCE